MELTKNEQTVALVSSAATALGAGLVYTVQLVKNRKKISRKKEIKKRLRELGKIIATNHYMSKESKEAIHEQYELAKELAEL
jgi:ATP:corrinoid adenosyltransferase